MSLTKEHQQRLLAVARHTIEQGVRTGKPLKINLAEFPGELTVLRATFVTLEKRQQLRGCIGALKAVRPLVEDIAENAYAAAFKDSRFSPLQADELEGLAIHLSILTPAEPVAFTSEQDLLGKLQPGIDGLILEEGYRRGTFLPAVWESLPEPRQFLRHLKQKAGLPASYWSDTLRIYRYRTDVIE